MNWRTLLHDFQGQMSWGRVVSACALAVAVVGSFNGMDLDMLKAWLGVVLGSYGSSKVVEAISSVRNKIE